MRKDFDYLKLLSEISKNQFMILRSNLERFEKKIEMNNCEKFSVENNIKKVKIIQKMILRLFVKNFQKTKNDHKNLYNIKKIIQSRSLTSHRDYQIF